MNRSANKSFGYKLVRRACNADWASESDVDDSSGFAVGVRVRVLASIRTGMVRPKPLSSLDSSRNHNLQPSRVDYRQPGVLVALSRRQLILVIQIGRESLEGLAREWHDEAGGGGGEEGNRGKRGDGGFGFLY